MRQGSLFVAALAAALIAFTVSACGGGGGDEGPKPPNDQQVGDIREAYGTVALGCLGPSPNGSKMTDSVDTLLTAFEKHGSASFKLASNRPPTTMKKLLQDSRDQLRNCEAAGVLPNASSLAGNIDAQLNK